MNILVRDNDTKVMNYVKGLNPGTRFTTGDVTKAVDVSWNSVRRTLEFMVNVSGEIEFLPSNEWRTRGVTNRRLKTWEVRA